ncbi:MAG: DinB/UmuC family translesion DNA polymerase, partial [Planctomycetota bacterium]
EIAERLRRHGRLARTVTVKIRSGDFQTITRSRTLREATDLTEEVIATARALFGTWAAGSFRPLRLLGTSLSNLVEPEAARQPSLFDAGRDERRRRLDAATDDIRRRFGTGAIGRGDRAAGD